MKTTPWLKTITIDDMPNDDLKFVAEEAGLKQALLLIFLLPGITINIPKNGLRRLKEKYIMKNYDGTKSKLNKLTITGSVQFILGQTFKADKEKYEKFFHTINDL